MEFDYSTVLSYSIEELSIGVLWAGTVVLEIYKDCLRVVIVQSKEILMKPKSDNLFHFTKTINVLELILLNGIYPKYCLEDVRWMGLSGLNYLAFPISCFCDIPLSRIFEHTGFYGQYGVGLSKKWGAKNNLNPVAYSPPSGQLQELMKFFFKTEIEDNEDLKREFDMQAVKLWSLIKPTYGNMLVHRDVVEKEFYQENEWRYVAPIMSKIIDEENFSEEKDEADQVVEEFKLEIAPTDIKYIFVKSDTDIPRIIDFINNKLGDFPLKDLKILQSRVVSLETLSCDI
ncbi:MAG: hypothetical protein GY893_14265 [bacterium]|nr:hypothetical protein [bacterium]